MGVPHGVRSEASSPNERTNCWTAARSWRDGSVPCLLLGGGIEASVDEDSCGRNYLHGDAAEAPYF